MKKAPVRNPRAAKQRGGLHWVEPRLVVEVAFAEWTGDGVAQGAPGKVRQASFRGVREDLDPEQVKLERAAPVRATGPRRVRGEARARQGETVAGVRITNPDRVLFADAGVTKLDLARHYERVAPLLLPHATDRPLTLVRCPSGVDGPAPRQSGNPSARCFYQKHVRSSMPASVTRVPIEKEGGTELYLAVDSVESLLSLVQHGVVELHLWGSRKDRLDRPDRLVIDLDPAPDVPWKAVVLAARHVRGRLDELGLESFPLSTGGKGLHVVAPLRRTRRWPAVKGFAHGLALALARELPEAFVAVMAKKVRTGKIFVDYLRNDEESTAICPWSVRARPGAPVAAPTRWEELDPERPALVTLRDLEASGLPDDPWPGYFDLSQAITAAALKAVKAR